jgi:hypothetical protein
MRNRYLIPGLLLLAFHSTARQSPVVLDSIKLELSRTSDPEKRVAILGNLSRLYMNENLIISDSFGKKMLQEAEISRDRKLVGEALLVNGEGNSYLGLTFAKI